MNTNGCLWIKCFLLLGLVMAAGCKDDPAAPEPSKREDIYTVLEISRTISEGTNKAVSRKDSLFARFDKIAGDDPDTPLQAESVAFGALDLVWDGIGGYTFVDNTNPAFLDLGLTYDFAVAGNAAVPSLEVPIPLMDIEPYATNLEHMQEVSLNGFTLEWNGGTPDDSIHLVLRSAGVSGEFVVPNTGTHDFTASNLVSLATGPGSIDINWSGTHPLDADGITSGSHVLLSTGNTTAVVFSREPLTETDTFVSTPDLTIPDALNNKPGARVRDTINVAATGVVRAIRVYLKITHPYSIDLTAQLTSPDGTQLRVLWRGEGGEPLADMAGWYPTDFTPKDPLGGFNGLEIGGNWTLTVQDVDWGGDGVLDEWRLEIEYLP